MLPRLTKFDVVVVGGGPAGCQCALWLKQLDFVPCIIEKHEKIGGLFRDSPYPEKWTSIVQAGIAGTELAKQMHKTIENNNICCFFNCTVVDVDVVNSHYSVGVRDINNLELTIEAPYLVVATGAMPKAGQFLPNERIILGPSFNVYTQDFQGKRVAIFGGGDNAFENYYFVRSKGAAIVNIYARSIRASKRFLDSAPVENVFLGDFSLKNDMQVGNQQYDIFIVMYGWEPSISFLDKFNLERDNRGYIKTALHTAETSIQNIYAIGEVANRMHPCCVTSLADGVVAAKAIQKKIEAGVCQDFMKRVLEKHSVVAIPNGAQMDE